VAGALRGRELLASHTGPSPRLALRRRGITRRVTVALAAPPESVDPVLRAPEPGPAPAHSVACPAPAAVARGAGAR